MQQEFLQGLAMKIVEGDHSNNSGRYVAWLNMGSATPPARCYVENISKFGAELKIFGPPVPDEFTLHFSRRGDAKIRCRVRSVGNGKCDVEFVASLAMYADRPEMPGAATDR
jgi:hypothetical protein